ncbi:hypothetical protein E2C01_065202 [Portunus trituberculatus]|uniref:Uncharacterized protein n=1 Tax=Portunus trituberculatus TaxID=210409 RepID=A0A5B7HNZ1_PORTR|nr:hypothetical protein [Portunus trituberculatus]
MNLAALHENPHARKRRWRVTTHEDGASPENCGRWDACLHNIIILKWSISQGCIISKFAPARAPRQFKPLWGESTGKASKGPKNLICPGSDINQPTQDTL